MIGKLKKKLKRKLGLEEPAISVVLPNYNGSDFLKKAVDSVLTLFFREVCSHVGLTMAELKALEKRNMPAPNVGIQNNKLERRKSMRIRFLNSARISNNTF